MKKLVVGTAVVSALLLFSFVSRAQDIGQGTVYVMNLLGITDPEDLDENEVESLSAYLESPLEINIVTPARLLSSGLFTPYRAASLEDYRARHGDVLSLEELSAVDGFSEEAVRALAPFISLRSEASPGRATEKNKDVHNALTARGAVRRVGSETQYSYGMKYRIDIAGQFQFGLSANRAYSGTDASPEGGSFYLAYYGQKRLGKIVFGDYRLRFGQGLALWSGFRMDSFTSPDAFCLRSSGISPYWSFTGDGSYRGVAADFNAGRLSVSASIALNGLREIMAGDGGADLSLMPAVNVGWYGRKVRIGVTGYCTTSALNSASSTSTRSGSPVYAMRTRSDLLGELARTGTQTLDEGALEASDSTGRIIRAVVSVSAEAIEEEFWEEPLSAAGCSADFRWCPGGTDVFGEVAADLMDMKFKALLGTIFRLGDSSRAAVRAGYAEDEYTLSAVGNFSAGRSVQLSGKSGFGSSVRKHVGSLGTELCWFPGKKYGAEGPNYQFKAVASYSLQISPSVSLAARYSLRLRSAGETMRNDLRCDLKYSSGEWSGAFRINALYNTGLGLLGYVEGGWCPGWMSMYLRAGLFRIDNWADRIYVYERDAPGNFSVPAYYGRGYWVAFTAGAKVARFCKLYLRLSTLQYPWTSPTASTRTPKSELKFMVVLNL